MGVGWRPCRLGGDRFRVSRCSSGQEARVRVRGRDERGAARSEQDEGGANLPSWVSGSPVAAVDPHKLTPAAPSLSQAEVDELTSDASSTRCCCSYSFALALSTDSPLCMKRSSPPPTDPADTPAAKRTTLAQPASLDSPSSSSTMSFLVQRLVEAAKMPARGSALAAGYDLAACVPLSRSGSQDCALLLPALTDPSGSRSQRRGQGRPCAGQGPHQYRACHRRP